MLTDTSALRDAGKDLISLITNVMDRADWEGLRELATMLPHVNRTFVSGAGRSGLIARSFGMRLMHVGLTAFIPGETITPAASEGDLLVAISCTGKTGFTEYLANRAHENGSKVIVLTSDGNSQLAKVADKVIVIPADASDIVIRAAVFEHATSLCLDSVFNVLAKQLKFDLAKYRQRHANLE